MVEMSDCVVIGIGNTIRSDDGAGVEVVRRLRGKVPDGMELVEGSVYCADLFGFLDGRRRAIFIDGIDAGDEPGTVFRFTPEQARDRKEGHSLSVHDFGLYDLISSSRLLGRCPGDITIFAIQVGSTEVGEQLTPEVSSAVDRVCAMVLEELGSNEAY